MERLEFDKNKFDFYAYLRKSSKNSTQDLSLDTQNTAVQNFIKNYTNIDFKSDINIIMEVASAYKKQQKINMRTGKIEDANNQRPEFKEMLETIQKNHYKTGKKAIIFLYNTSRLTRNIKDGEQIKNYLGIEIDKRFLHTAPIEKIIFTFEKIEWNSQTDSSVIENAIIENKGYSKNLSKNLKGAILSKLENGKIPGDLRLDFNTPFKNEKGTFKLLDNYPKFEKILKMYKSGSYTQKEICKLLDIHCNIKLSPSRFKEYFKRDVFTGYYTNFETGEILEIPFNTEDKKNPIPKYLIDYVLKNKRNTGLEYGKLQESDFIAQILKTVDGRKASFCIPGKDKGKKAIYYNFSNKQSIPFNAKFSKRDGVVQAVDKFELLPKLFFIYSKIYLKDKISKLEKELKEYLEIRLKEDFKIILEKEEIEILEKEEIEIIEDLKDFQDIIEIFLYRKGLNLENNLNFIEFLELEEIKYIDKALISEGLFLYLAKEIKILKSLLKKDFEDFKKDLNLFLEKVFINNNLIIKTKKEIEKVNKNESELLKAEITFNKLEIFYKFKTLKKKKTKEEIKEKYLKNLEKILIDEENKRKNIYNTLYTFFKPYLKSEENKEFTKETIKEINKKIKEQEELKNKKIDYCINEELPKEFLMKAIKPFELEIDKLKEQKKELEKQALDFGQFQTLINSFEKIFNIILKIDTENPGTLTFTDLLAKKLLTKADFEEIIKNTTFELILYPSFELKINVFAVFNTLVSGFGCGDRNGTCDLRVMSPTRYHFSTPL